MLDEAVSIADSLAKLDLNRGKVETRLRDFKPTIKVDVLKCKTVEGITNERTMDALVDKMDRVMILESA